jgi:hypothetical protein
MPYPDDERQPPPSPARTCGDTAGITTDPARADAGGMTATAAATRAPAGAVASASVNTKDRTGVHRPHAGGAVASRRAWPDNGGTPLGGERGRRCQ